MSLPSVLHVEVGGSYGGSLRALELYLGAADRDRLRHQLLLYYPTPGAERLRPLVDNLYTLEAKPPLASPDRGSRPRLPAWIPRRRPTRRVEDVLVLAAQAPRLPRLARLLRASDCDLVHCNNSFWYQAPTLLAARHLGLPVAAHLRNPPPSTWLTRRLARIPAALLALHEEQAAALRAWSLPGELAICPDGVTLPRAGAAAAAAWRQHLGIAPDAILLGSIGRLDPQKGYADLLQAAVPLLRKRPELHLVIVGDGSERPRLAQLVAQSGLPGRIHLPGFDPDPAAVLAALDLFISSSRWEGLPLAVLEALLAGVPAVATLAAIRGEPALTAHLAAAPATSAPPDLARAIEEGLANPHSRERAACGRDWVGATFSPAVSARRLDEALERALRPTLRGRSFYEHAYRAPGWNRQSHADESAGVRFTKMWYRAFLEHVLPGLCLQHSTVLEVGAGYGYLVPHLRARGARYIGVDIAASALQQFAGAPQTLPVLGDACQLPLASASCDLVICMEVFEHIPDPERLVGELRRVVRPQGRVILSCPNYGNMYLPLKLLADAGVARAAGYIKRQPIDHTLFALGVRRRLERSFQVLEQRAVRLHPPLFERLDYRTGGASRLNNAVFDWERRYGHRFPWRWLGLHTCFVLQPRAAHGDTRAPREHGALPAACIPQRKTLHTGNAVSALPASLVSWQRNCSSQGQCV